MKHFKITYNPERRKLTIFYNDKPLCGMIGPMAEERYKVLKAEMEKVDILKQVTNGHKAKTPKV